MTLFPEAQAKARAEIDAVIGSDRLPSFADRDSLPYVEALVKEVLRWNAVAPAGIFVAVYHILPLTCLSVDRCSPPCH